jgi:hypothetical protein
MTLRSRRPLLAGLAALALSASASAAFAQFAPSATGGAALLPTPPAGQGQVVFYRKPMFSLIPFNWIVREDKTEICEMVAGTYCVAAANPGTHTYEVHSEVKNDLTLEVDAGETYYVVGGIAMGVIVNHPTIAPTPKAQFDALSPRLKVKAPILAAPAPVATPVADPAPAPAPAAPAAAQPPA